MPCNPTDIWTPQPPPLGLLDVPDVLPQCQRTCLAPTDTDYFYPNYPEKMLHAYMPGGVLWADPRILAGGQSQIHYRCFLWHTNKTNEDGAGVPLYAGLTLANLSSASVYLSESYGEGGVMFTDEGTGPNPPTGFASPFRWYGDIGLGGRCIAMAMLAPSLDSAAPENMMVPAGQTRLVRHWGQLSPGRTYGVYYSFDAAGSPGASWVLREVFAQNQSDLVTRTALPVALDSLSGDGRGNWSGNQVTLQAPVLNITSDNPTPAHRLRLAADRNSNQDACWPDDTANGVRGDLGKYGCLYANQGYFQGITLPFHIEQEHPSDVVLQAWLTSTAPSFFGAAKTGNGVLHAVPPISFSNNQAILLQSATYLAYQPQPVNDAFLVSAAVAGAASTPFDIVLRAV